MRRKIFSSPPTLDSAKKKPKTEFERFDGLAKRILLQPKKANRVTGKRGGK